MDKSSTPKLDPTTLTPTQLAGVSCVYCHAEDNAMQPVATVAGHGQVFACVTCPVEQARADVATAAQHLRASVEATKRELPESWARDAERAAARASEAVKGQYESTMRALRKDLGEDRPRAYWLESHPCPAWCAHPESHRSGDDPTDRYHDSESHSVRFDTMEPSTAYAEYRAPELRLYLSQGYREAEARVAVEFEGDVIAHATLDEMEALAFQALDLVRKARGLEPLQVLPFDAQGRCDDASCISCRRDTGKATA